MSIKTARKLGFWTAMAMLFGSIVGIGIFFKNGSVLRATSGDGLTSLLAWVLGGLLSLFAAISFSEIGSQKLRNVHGLAGWTETSMGKRAGYFVRFNFAFFYYGILMVVMGVFVSSAFFQVLEVGGISTGVLAGEKVYVHILLGLAFSAFFVTMNILSVYVSGIFSTVASILKFIPLALAALMGVILATTNLNELSPIGDELSVQSGSVFFKGSTIYQQVFDANGLPILSSGAPTYATISAIDKIDLNNPIFTLQGGNYVQVWVKTTGFNVFDKPTNFTFTGLLAALPGVLFAYDSFLAIGTMSAKTRGGSKTVSRVTIFTMVLVVILYTLVSVSQLIHATGTIQGTFAQVLPNDVQKPMTIFVWTFILFSALGVHNGMVAVGVASIQQGFMTRTFIGDKSSAKKLSFRTSMVLSVLSVYAFWSVVIFVPAIALNSDAPIDTFSNYPTIFFFAVYGANIIAYWRKRKAMKTEKINNILFYVASAIAAFGIVFVSAYQVFYGFTIRAFISPNDSSSAGFLSAGSGLNLIQEFGFFAAGLFIFCMAPVVNYMLTMKFENNNPIIDTQALAIDEVMASTGNDDGSSTRRSEYENTKTVKFRTKSGQVFRRKK